RLSQPFRLPVVLCYFEGLTVGQAARRLRVPVGTLRSRLARARDKLRRGLARRGVVLPSAAPPAALRLPSASGFVSSRLCEVTARTAMSFAAGRVPAGLLSSLAIVLAKDVLRSMVLDNLKIIALTVLLVLGGVVANAAILTRFLTMREGATGLPAV